MDVVFRDVGHGCCTIIITPNQRRVVLVDCNAGAGPATIRYLESTRLPPPDVICISHLHDDHVAGFAAIFKHLIDRGVGVERVYTNYAGHTSRKRRGDGGQAVVQQLRDLLDGQHDRLREFRFPEPPYELDGVTLTVLHPDNFDLQTHHDRDNMLNDLSGVLRVSYGQSSLLLPGDIEGWGASCLLSRHDPGQLRAQLMLFPHHGAGWEHGGASGTASTKHGREVISPKRFMEAVSPTWTVLSVGTENDGKWSTYKHPRQGVLGLLRDWHKEHGGGFVCTEVTPRCSSSVCDPVTTIATNRPIRVPCGGTVRFSLGTNGSISIDPTVHSDWQGVVDRLSHPQCRT